MALPPMAKRTRCINRSRLDLVDEQQIPRHCSLRICLYIRGFQQTEPFLIALILFDVNRRCHTSTRRHFRKVINGAEMAATNLRVSGAQECYLGPKKYFV